MGADPPVLRTPRHSEVRYGGSSMSEERGSNSRTRRAVALRVSANCVEPVERPVPTTSGRFRSHFATAPASCRRKSAASRAASLRPLRDERAILARDRLPPVNGYTPRRRQKPFRRRCSQASRRLAWGRRQIASPNALRRCPETTGSGSAHATLPNDLESLICALDSLVEEIDARHMRARPTPKVIRK